MSLKILDINENNIDIDILIKLENEGLNYFTSKFNQIIKLDVNDLNYIYYKKYLNMFLIDNVFDNSGINYETLLKSILLDNLLVKLIEFINSEDRIVFCDKIIENLFNCGQIDSNNIYKLLINNKLYMKSICEGNYWMSDKNFISNLLEINTNGVLDNNTIFNLIFPILKSKITREYLINWFCDIYNKNIERKNLSHQEFHTEKEDNYMILIMYSCLESWIKGIDFDKLSKLKIEYIMGNSSKIKWVDKVKKDDNSYTYLNKSFFICHKLVEISVINLYEELNLIGKDISYIKSKLEEEKSKIDKNIYIIKAYSDRIQSLDNRKIVVDTILKKNSVLINKLKIFYQNTLYWIFTNIKIFTIETLVITDSILNNFHIFIKKNLDCIDNFDANFYQLVLIVLDENNITNNPNVKMIFLKLLIESIQKRSELSMIFISNNTSNLINVLIKFYVYLEDAFSDNVFEKITAQLYICEIFNNLESNQNIYYDFKYINDTKMFKRFINIFIGNLSNMGEEIFKALRELSKKQTENILETELDNIYGNKVRHYNYQLLNYLNVFKILTKTNTNYFVETGIRDKCAFIINFLLYELVGSKKNELVIKDKDKYSFKPILFLESLYKSILNLSELLEFKKAIASEARYYSYLHIKKLISILEKYDKITSFDINLLQLLDYEIIKLNQVYLEEEEIEIPDEFCDPIMQTMIEVPVYLPNTDTIMDKEIITRHLLTDEHNPFNREKLTLDMLEEYNMRTEIKIKLDEFIKTRDSWKMKIK